MEKSTTEKENDVKNGMEKFAPNQIKTQNFWQQWIKHK